MNTKVKRIVSLLLVIGLLSIFSISAFADEKKATANDKANKEVSKVMTDKDYYEDDKYDLKGNASLVENRKIIYENKEMQFISVTTKDGHIFYVLINYSAGDGEEAVYFLNKVDDIDLKKLLEENKDNNDNTDGEEADEEAQNQKKQTDNSSMTGTYVKLGAVVVLIIVGIVIYKKVLGKGKGKKSKKEDEEIIEEDDLDFEEE